MPFDWPLIPPDVLNALSDGFFALSRAPSRLADRVLARHATAVQPLVIRIGFTGPIADS